MSEMLGNRYLFAGKFNDAAEQFEAVLRRRPDRIPARMKLIGCYVLQGHLQEAVELATGLVRDNADALLQADLHTEGFPCDDAMTVIRQRAKSSPPGVAEASLGVLLLFCDEQEAARQLTLALEINPFLTELQELKTLVSRHLEARNV